MRRSVAGRSSLRVTDDGPGIPPQALPHIFDKFVKGRCGRRPMAGRAPASGLPSPRASWRRMAARSRPRARVADGRGTRIVLTFPREDAPA